MGIKNKGRRKRSGEWRNVEERVRVMSNEKKGNGEKEIKKMEKRERTTKSYTEGRIESRGEWGERVRSEFQRMKINARQAHFSYSSRPLSLRGCARWLDSRSSSLSFVSEQTQSKTEGNKEGHLVLPSHTHTPDQIPQMETNWAPHKQKDVEKACPCFVCVPCSMGALTSLVFLSHMHNQVTQETRSPRQS